MDSNMDSDILMDGLAVGEMLKIMQEKKNCGHIAYSLQSLLSLKAFTSIYLYQLQ